MEVLRQRPIHDDRSSICSVSDAESESKQCLLGTYAALQDDDDVVPVFERLLAGNCAITDDTFPFPINMPPAKGMSLSGKMISLLKSAFKRRPSDGSNTSSFDSIADTVASLPTAQVSVLSTSFFKLPFDAVKVHALLDELAEMKSLPVKSPKVPKPSLWRRIKIHVRYLRRKSQKRMA